MKTHEDLENEYFDACQNARLEGEQFMDDAEIQSKQQKKMKQKEIIFKAKRSDGKGWVEGDLLSKDRYRINSHSSADLVKVIPETVCLNLDKDLFVHDIVNYKGKDYFIQDGGFYYYLERNMVIHGENEMILLNEDVVFELKLTGKNIHDEK